MRKMAHAQAFGVDDQLGRMVKNYSHDSLSEEDLDLVFAARKDDAEYSEFLRLAKERENKNQ